MEKIWAKWVRILQNWFLCNYFDSGEENEFLT